jgi:hypothetical protein
MTSNESKYVRISRGCVRARSGPTTWGRQEEVQTLSHMSSFVSVSIQVKEGQQREGLDIPIPAAGSQENAQTSRSARDETCIALAKKQMQSQVYQGLKHHEPSPRTHSQRRGPGRVNSF